MKKMLIVIFLFCGKCYSQPSFNFTLWFNLSDKQEERITPEKFNTLKVYSPYGVQVSTVIQNDTIANMFKLTAESSITKTFLVFVSKNDTTIITFNADHPYTCIDSIPLDGNYYDFYFDKWNTDKFNCIETLNGYLNKQVCKTVVASSSFRAQNILQANEMNFENPYNWVEVKLNK